MGTSSKIINKCKIYTISQTILHIIQAFIIMIRNKCEE